MKSWRDFFGGVLAILALTSTSAHARTRVEGVWDDSWMGGHGDWLPLVLALIVCTAIWLARRKQKKKDLSEG